MTTPYALHARAQEEAAPLPALLAQAEQLAATVLLGAHGRRRAGRGEDFWQYRTMQPGDSAGQVDWRRSGRGDEVFTREHEWQVAQNLQIWCDPGASMRFASSAELTSKADRARLLALACSVLLIRGGERVGLLGRDAPPQGGRAQLMRLADALCRQDGEDEEYAAPKAAGFAAQAQALFISDFLAEPAALEAALEQASARGVRGVLLQVLDPGETRFPFTGRVVFESPLRSLRHESRGAGALKERYLERLEARKAHLEHLARLSGWRYHLHLTDHDARTALIWLWQALGERQG